MPTHTTRFRFILAGAIAALLPHAVRAQAPDSPASLPEVTVQGVMDRGFTTTEASSATRGLPAPVLDTPRSIQTVNRELIETRQINDVQEAVQTIPGVQRAGSFIGQGETFLLRGFLQDSLIKDGFRAGLTPGAGDFTSLAPTDVANLERIEFLKGPSAILFGRGEPGGVVNYITRLPVFENRFSLEQQFGSYDFYRTEGSANFNIAPDKFALRLDAAYDRGDSFVDFVRGERYFVAPSAIWKIGPDTTLTFRGEYSHDFRANSPGLPYDAGRVLPQTPYSRYFGEPGFTNFTTETLRGLLQLEHRWTESQKTVLSVHARHAHQHGLYFLLFNFAGPFIQPDGSVSRASASTDFSDDNLTVRLDHVFDWTIYEAAPRQVAAPTGKEVAAAEGKGAKTVVLERSPFAIKNQLLLSAEWDWQRQDDARGLGSYASIDPRDPCYGNLRRTPLIPIPGLPTVLGEFTKVDTDAYSLLAMDRLSFGETVYLSFGARLEFFDGDRATVYGPGAPFAPSDLRGGDTNVNPFAGLVIKPARNWSLYGNYSEGTNVFTSFNATTVTGSLLEPERSRQFEVGIKAEFFDRRLIASAAAFHIEKTDVVGADAANPLFSANNGDQRSRGFELELNGEILPGWRVSAGYAYVDARITSDPGGLTAGNRRFGVPEHSGGFFTTYEFQEGPLKGLGVGGGMNFNDRVEVDNANSGNLSGFATTDLALYYRYNRFRFQVNAKNLFDNEYYFAANQNTSVQPGPARVIVGSVRFDF